MAAPVAVAAPFLPPIHSLDELGFLAMIYAWVASVALVVCVIVHTLLVVVGRQRLRHYLLAYLIILQPLLVSAPVSLIPVAPLGFTAGASPSCSLPPWLCSGGSTIGYCQEVES